MKPHAYFFRIGEFSLINDAVFAGLTAEFSALDWRTVDVERDIVERDLALRLRATAESMVRYGGRIAAQRQPPRDFFPRIPAVITGVRRWVRANVDPQRTAFVFQTQSLFDARHPAAPHFLYTDHTYLANRRYAEPKPLLPVAESWRDMERGLYAGADCNFTASEFAAQSVREDYDVSADRVECVYSGSNVAAAEDGVKSRGGRRILFVGVDWERKGGPELVQAFRTVRAGIPDAELWIVGCTPAVTEPGVTILGRMPAERVAEHYRSADVFCLPSRVEPAGSVLVEAALHGLPIVATRVGGIPDRVEDGVTGFLCAPSELADQLAGLLRDGALRRKLGEAGRQLAQRRFTWPAVCARMAGRIRKTLES